MAAGAITVTVYDRSWTSQGTVTSAFSPSGSFLRNDAGEGSFVFPIYDTPAKTLVQYNRIAVVTVEESGSTSSVVAAFHIHNLTPKRIRSGGYDGYVVEVSGPGILAELQWDNIGYATISDGSQGPTLFWLGSILAFAQETWSVNGIPSSAAYLKAAGETVWDALLECCSQIGVGISYAPAMAIKTIAPKGRRILFLETPIGGSVILDWNNLDLVKSGAAGDECTVLSIVPIEDVHEVATRVTIYGAGIGADVLTIEAAQGNVTVPTGFSVDWANSIITNDTLEAVSDQPVMHRLHQAAHIKPEDNEDATAVETAAIQLFWAGISYLRDRDAGRRQSYEVTFVGYPGYNYAVGQLANLVYTENSNINASGTPATTAVINVNDDFVVHEMRITVPNSGELAGSKVITVILGEQVSSDVYMKPLPSDGDVVIKKLKEHDEILRHATASYAPTSPGGTPTYATADAPFLVLSNTTNLTNERVFVPGAGLAATDGGANGSYTVNVATADTSMTINADSIQVRLASTSGLQISTGLMIADTVAGAGLTIASKILAVGAGDGIDVAADSIAVDVTDFVGDGLVEVATNNIALGTPGSITSTSTNAVTTSSHTHAIDSTIALSNIAYVTIGNTGSLSAERSLTAGDGLDLADGGANSTVTLSVDVTDIIGNGLVEVATNNIALGTPGSITSTSTNAVTTTSHTHAIDSTIALVTDLHDAVTLGADTAPLFSIGAGQVLNFDPQTANTVLAGPTSGGAADPTMRTLVDADIPSSIARDSEVTSAIATHAALPNAHHNQSHVLATTSALGADHTVSGLTARQVLIAGSATTANFRALVSADLPTGSTLSVSSSNSGTSHAITNSSDPGSTATILSTNSSGYIRIAGIAIGSGVPMTGNDVAYSGNLISYKGAASYNVYGFVSLSSPLESTSWDGDAKTAANSGTLALDTIFSVPSGVTAVLVRLAVKDASADQYVSIGPSVGANDTIVCRTQVANIWSYQTGIVPLTSNDMYVSIGSNIDQVYIQIWGYFI